MSETKGTAMSETAVERRLRDVREDGRIGSLELLPEEMAAIDAGREALAIAREGVPRYLQNGGCSNCGGVPHTDTCLIGKFAALLARCEGDG